MFRDFLPDMFEELRDRVRVCPRVAFAERAVQVFSCNTAEYLSSLASEDADDMMLMQVGMAGRARTGRRQADSLNRSVAMCLTGALLGGAQRLHFLLHRRQALPRQDAHVRPA